MTVDLLVRGGRCVLADGVQDADLGISDGRIAVIVRPGLGAGADAVLDAAGFLVLAGAVDAHVHVRDPGHTHKEDYVHATRAAAVSGVTTIVSQPNTDPAVTDLRGLAAVLAAACESRVDHAVCAGVTATAPDRGTLAALAHAGVVAIEVLGDTAALDGHGWLRLFDAVAPTGLPLACLAADRTLMEQNAAEARARPGASWRDWSRLVSGDAEVLGITRAVALARRARVPLIVRQVTTADGLDVLRRAKRAVGDAPLWVEVNVHHLFLTNDDLERLGPYTQMVPPPRPASDVAALWEGVRDGTVDFISSDHAPHAPEEKERGRVDPWAGPTGIPGLDTLVCLLVDAALDGRLTLTRLTELLSAAPSRIHRLAPTKGALAVGADADLVLIDPAAAAWTIDESRIFTRCGWSAFAGRRGRGAPVATLLRGQVVARDGKPLDRAVGRFVAPGRQVTSDARKGDPDDPRPQ